MSGIAGILYPNHFQTKEMIAPVLKALAHRGPGLSDTYNYKNLQLGSCGNKIASDEKKSVFALVDGSIFNSAELVSELRSLGYVLDKADMAQLVVAAYSAWGAHFPEKLDGEFAIAVFDRHKEVLYLIRDRIGTKPLYWYQDNHHFIFASELKGILASGLVPQTPALDGLSAYLTMGYIPQDMTPIQNVNKLLPGHYLKYEFHVAKTIQPYWSYSHFFTMKNPESLNMGSKELDRLLQQAVMRRVSPSQPMGCLVSGGLGSAAIAYYLKRICGPSRLTLFTAGFQGPNDEDIQVADQVAKKLQLPHEIDLITPKNFLDDFVKIAWYLDEPQAFPNVIATWNLAKMASSQVKVVYSGMGSDELLAGHSRYTLGERELPFKTLIAQFAQPVIKKLVAPLVSLFSSRLSYKILRESRTNPWQAGYLIHNSLFDEKRLAAAAPALAGLFDLNIFLSKFHHLSRIKSLVSSFIYFDVKTRLADLYNAQYDRMMSAFGLDWRTPFLDQYIVEYLAGMTESENMQDRDTSPFLKLILREVYPPEIINRTKKIRKNLLKSWVESPELLQLFHCLTKGALVEAGLVSSDWIAKQIKTPEKCIEAYPYLWAILSLEVWYRLYIHAPPGTEPKNISIKELLGER